jgi:hypothetical protein
VSLVRITLALGLGMTLTAAIAVLSQSPPVVIATNDAPGTEAHLGLTSTTDARVCQGGETLHGGTVAIRFSVYALTGPPVQARVLYGGRTVAFGERGSGWTGAGVTIPIRAAAHSVPAVTVCLAATAPSEPMPVLGTLTRPAIAAYGKPGHAYLGRMRIVYLGSGHTSWMSLAPTVARRMGLGRAWSGTWAVVLVVALMLGALSLLSALVLRELDV